MFENLFKLTYKYNITFDRERYIGGNCYIFYLLEHTTLLKYLSLTTRKYPLVFYFDSKSGQCRYRFVKYFEKKEPYPFTSKEEGDFYANELLRMCVYDDYTGKINEIESKMIEYKKYTPLLIEFKNI